MLVDMVEFSMSCLLRSIEHLMEGVSSVRVKAGIMFSAMGMSSGWRSLQFLSNVSFLLTSGEREREKKDYCHKTGIKDIRMYSY